MSDRYDPMTGEPIKKGKKNRKWILALGAVAVLAIIVFAGFKSGLFLSMSNKVLVAIVNTIGEQPRLVKNLDALKILSSDSYTVGVEAEAEDAYVEMQYSVSSSEKQLSGSISYEYIPNIDFVAALTASQVKLQVPDIDDRVFTYNYKEEKEGYITEILRDGEIEAFDKACETLYSPKQQKDFKKEITEIVLDEYHSLKFEKADKEEFKVNGKDRKCKGYQTTITADNLVNINDEIEKIVEDNYEDTLEEADIDIDDMFDELRDGLEEFPDMDVTFYIYKNEIACISLEVDREELQILFKGGDKGMQNIEVVIDDYGTVMELEGSVKGTMEKYRVEIDETEIAALEYNYKSGDFTLETGRQFGSITAEGNLQSNSEGMTFALEDFELEGVEASLAVSIQKGSSMKKLKGEEFDLGNASESDLEELAEDLSYALDL